MPSVRVDGAWHEMDTVSVKVSGAWHEKDTGHCKVEGAWHEWDMGPSVIPVTITGSGHYNRCYVTIAGNSYSEATDGIEVQAGDTVYMEVYGKNDSTHYGSITIDGESVAGTSSGSAEYTWTVPQGCNAITINLSYKSSTIRYSGTITVTTT